jgi:Mg-chelatase subunit ChlD
MVSWLGKQSRFTLAFLLPAFFSMMTWVSVIPAPAAAADDDELELKRGDLSDPPAPSPSPTLEDSRAGSDEAEAADKSENSSDSAKHASDSLDSSSIDGSPDSSQIRTPFNLNVQTSVIDGGADHSSLQGGTRNNSLGGGIGTGDMGSQFPTLGTAANRPGLKGGTATMPLSGGLSQEQLQRLARHDLVLIIDQSSSMHTQDCPVSGLGRVGGTVMGMLLGPAASVSRWQWCRDQTLNLAEQTRYVSAKGLSVVLFSGNFVVFPHVTVDQIPNIFKQASPQGGTNLTEPLRATINDFFARQTATRGNVKPLAIAVITDGLPNSEANVCKVLVDTTKVMRDPRDIKITFFLIGNSAYNGQAFVSELEKNLPKYGAKFNFVRSVSFWNLMKVGLSRALADALE